MTVIPPFRYALDEEDAAFIVAAVSKLLLSGDFLTLGRHNETFEHLFSEAHDVSYAVSVSSGTAALEILLRAAQVSGRKVIIPSNTYGATAVAVLRAGGTPVFAECGFDLNIDPDHVESLLSRDVAAVVVVHIGGLMSSGLPRLCSMCERYGIPLIEDAAHATGSTLAGRATGAWGLGAAFSFFSTKVVTCAEGGMILTNDTGVRDLARLLRDHAKRSDGGMDVVGYNWRLSELQAIMGIAQMRKLPEILAARRRVAEHYASVLSGLPHIAVVKPPENALPNYYKQIVRVPAGLREKIRERLQMQFNVTLGGEVYAVPCHLQPAFECFANNGLPITEKMCASHICPPIYPTMSTAERQYAGDALRTVIGAAVESWNGTPEHQQYLTE